MAHHATDTAAPDALELRVLEGPQGGASAPLAAGRHCVLAAEPRLQGSGADIVLLEEQAPARLRVHAAGTQAMIDVLSGEVQLGEQVYAAGAQAVWASGMPLRIGGSVVAFGPAAVAHWPTPAAGAAAAADTPPEGTAAASGEAEPAPRPLLQRAELWLAATGAGVLLACLGTLLMARVIAAPTQVASGPATLAAALKSSEFAGLDTTVRPDGQVVVHGRLGTLAERARLGRWLAAQPSSAQFIAQVDVQVDEAVGRDVAEVFRVNDVPAQARVVGPGQIEAEVVESDPARLSRAEGVVRRDVRGIDRLTVRNIATPKAPPAPPVPDDPGKRIASLVQGDPAYVVTVDGSRYFVGATLPSGHRITNVGEQRVTLDRDGHVSTLNF